MYHNKKIDMGLEYFLQLFFQLKRFSLEMFFCESGGLIFDFFIIYIGCDLSQVFGKQEQEVMIHTIYQ